MNQPMSPQRFGRLGASPDTFRRQFKPMSAETAADLSGIKQLAGELLDAIVAAYNNSADRQQPADPRCLATAQSSLEGAVMFAVKGLTE